MKPLKSSATQGTTSVAPDGARVVQYMHPAVHGNAKQSLAEARIAPGQKTLLHRHCVTEELYHFLKGTGVMILGAKALEVEPGDTVCILPGTPHCLENTGLGEMRFLCCCSPPYSLEDTEILVSQS